MRGKLTLAKETLRALDEQELSWVVGGGGNEHDKDKKKHNNGSNGSGKGPSGDGPPGCKKKDHKH